jgi:hypothetical protein
MNKKVTFFIGLFGYIFAGIIARLVFSKSFSYPGLGLQTPDYSIANLAFLSIIPTIVFILFFVIFNYLFKDRESITLKSIGFILLFSSISIYIWRTLLVFGIGSNDLPVDPIIGLLGFVGTLTTFIYLSYHSLGLYKSSSRLWVAELIASIVVLVSGTIFSASELSYSGLVLLPASLVFFLFSFFTLLIKSWRETHKSSFFFSILGLLVIIFSTGLFFVIKVLSECCH